MAAWIDKGAKIDKGVATFNGKRMHSKRNQWN